VSTATRSSHAVENAANWLSKALTSADAAKAWSAQATESKTQAVGGMTMSTDAAHFAEQQEAQSKIAQGQEKDYLTEANQEAWRAKVASDLAKNAGDEAKAAADCAGCSSASASEAAMKANTASKETQNYMKQVINTRTITNRFTEKSEFEKEKAKEESIKSEEDAKRAEYEKIKSRENEEETMKNEKITQELNAHTAWIRATMDPSYFKTPKCNWLRKTQNCNTCPHSEVWCTRCARCNVCTQELLQVNGTSVKKAGLLQLQRRIRSKKNEDAPLPCFPAGTEVPA